MDDLIKRLRENGVDPYIYPGDAVDVMNEAAERIEELERELDALKKELESVWGCSFDERPTPAQPGKQP